KLELDAPGTRAPLLSVFGGKITTYRRLAEEAMSHLHGALGFTHGDWTAGAPLPGGDMAEPDAGVFETSLRAQMPWLPSSLAQRYAHTYGTRT
ncbi:glycerol-3-phosphate dehydrogenase, partial [Pandoraea pneumonica]